MPENGLSRNGILILLGVVASVAVFGSVMSPQNTVAIIGFCSMICVSLFSVLQQVRAAGKVEQVAITAKEAAVEVKEVKADLKAEAAATTEKLNNLAQVGDEQTGQLKEIHKAVNSALTAAEEDAAESKMLTYLALNQIAEMTTDGVSKAKAKKIAEAARVTAEKAAKTLKAKADALAASQAKEPRPHPNPSQLQTAIEEVPEKTKELVVEELKELKKDEGTDTKG